MNGKLKSVLKPILILASVVLFFALIFAIINRDFEHFFTRYIPGAAVWLLLGIALTIIGFFFNIIIRLPILLYNKLKYGSWIDPNIERQHEETKKRIIKSDSLLDELKNKYRLLETTNQTSISMVGNESKWWQGSANGLTIAFDDRNPYEMGIYIGEMDSQALIHLERVYPDKPLPELGSNLRLDFFIALKPGRDFFAPNRKVKDQSWDGVDRELASKFYFSKPPPDKSYYDKFTLPDVSDNLLKINEHVFAISIYANGIILHVAKQYLTAQIIYENIQIAQNLIEAFK